MASPGEIAEKYGWDKNTVEEKAKTDWSDDPKVREIPIELIRRPIPRPNGAPRASAGLGGGWALVAPASCGVRPAELRDSECSLLAMQCHSAHLPFPAQIPKRCAF